MSSKQPQSESACQHVEPLLDDLVDGALTADEHRRVETHLAECDACTERLASLERLLAEVDAMPRSLEPASDLWPGVAPRLTERRFTERRQAGRRVAGDGGGPVWWRQAAAAVVFMALGAGLSQFPWPVGGGEPAAIAGVEPASSAARSSAADFALAEADFLRAKEALWSAVYSSHDTAAPETREVVERNLAVIAGAIRELRAALEADPGNPQLEGLLLAQHRSEIGLLQRLTRATEI